MKRLVEPAAASVMRTLHHGEVCQGSVMRTLHGGEIVSDLLQLRVC